MLEFQTERAKYQVIDNILYLDYISDTYYDEAEAKEAVKMLHSFLDEHKIETPPLVVSAHTCNPKFTFAARRVLSSKEILSRYSCVAIVVNNALQKVLGTLFLAMSSNSTPMRIFDAKEEALDWAKEFSPKAIEN